MADRFQYEIAVRWLDVFVRRAKDEALSRAWKRAKLVVLAASLLDYYEGDLEEALSYGWQEMDVVFRGYGDETMTASVIQMWKTCPTALEKPLKRAIAAAFRKAAEASTCDYIHDIKFRSAPVRDLELGFDLPTIIPVRGPRLAEWARRNGLDPILVEKAIRMLQAGERPPGAEEPVEEPPMEAIEIASASAPPPKPSHLRVIK